MKSILTIHFFASETGHEPVRDWLMCLSSTERKAAGEDLKTVQMGWPLGMPLVRHLENGIWEVRVRLENRIGRVLFTLDGSTMVLLHAFIKKTQNTPVSELRLAKKRLKILKGR